MELWHGPSFLTKSTEHWPDTFNSKPEELELIEETRAAVALHVNVDSLQIFDRFSDLAKITKTIAFCYRFYHNASCIKNDRTTGSLCPNEYDRALKLLVRLAQREEFPVEVQLYERSQTPLTKAREIGLKSPLRNLNLFMDQFGLLRINGRLLNMKAPYDTRFPILLPANHKLSWLITRSFHIRTLHAGPSLLLATLRQRPTKAASWPTISSQGSSAVRNMLPM